MDADLALSHIGYKSSFANLRFQKAKLNTKVGGGWFRIGGGRGRMRGVLPTNLTHTQFPHYPKTHIIFPH